MDWGQIITNALRAAFGLEASYYALAAIGLNVHFGYTGLLNFGQAGFLAIGAYGMAISVTYLGWSLWAGVAVSVAAAVVFALLLGIPDVAPPGRLLAIVTIAASEILRLMFRSVTFRPVTGGSSGLQNFADDFYAINPYSPGTYRLEAVWNGGVGLVDVLRVVLALVLVAVVVERLTHGRVPWRRGRERRWVGPRARSSAAGRSPCW